MEVMLAKLAAAMARQPVLWNKGREERLALASSAEPFLRRLDPAHRVSPVTASERFLRPFPGRPSNTTDE